MKSKKIGVVGLGRMGSNIARRLAELGYPIAAVYDINPEVTASVASELSADNAKSLAEVSAVADVVVTVVTDDAAMRAIYSVDPSVDSLLKKAAGRIFINCATVSPEVHVEVAERAGSVGARVLEALMASSIPQARQGTLYLMVGGEKSLYEEMEPVLKDMSSQLRYIGPAGSAAKVKALVNMVMNINTAALAEGLGLGAALELDPVILKEVFAQTGANSRVLETDGDDMIQRDHDCYFSAAHAAKDSGIANALASGLGISVPLSQATEAQYRRLMEAGKGDLDKSAVAELTFPGRS